MTSILIEHVDYLISVNEHNEILRELEQYDAEEESDMDAFKICTHNDNGDEDESSD